MRALITFAAYSGMRPGELFALEWADVDLDAMLVYVAGACTGAGWTCRSRTSRAGSRSPRPPATRCSRCLATAGSCSRLSAAAGCRSRRSRATGARLARAGLDFDFYLATKHYCVHYMHATLGLEPRVIAEQMGWTLAGVLKLLAVYGHGDVGALEQIDRAFDRKVARLRAV